MSFIEQITNYVHAGYPVLWVRTAEDTRVAQCLGDLGKLLKYQDWRWTITNGWVSNSGESPEIVDASDPETCLMSIKNSRFNDSFCIIRNFHPYLDNPIIIQLIKDLVVLCKSTNRTIIFVSTQVDMPPELQKEITIVDFKLPDQKDLSKILYYILDSVDKDITITDEQRNAAVNAAMGMTEFEAENAYALSLVEAGDITPEIIQREKSQIIRKSGHLEYYKASDDLDSVGGLDNLKSWLLSRSRAFSDEAREFGLPSPRGVLLVGVPGCGKSLVSKAVALAWGLPLLKMDIGRLFGSLVGESEQNWRTAIELAEAMSPCVLWLDEIEKGLSGIQSSGQTDSGVTARVFGNLITWMNERTKPVFIVATAYNIMNLPPELMRKGRFDEIFAVDLPDEQERREIFNIHISKRGREPKNFNLKTLVSKTSGFSGAEIEEVVISGMYEAFSTDMELNTKHLITATEDTNPLSRTQAKKIAQIRDWAKNHAREASTRSNNDALVEVRAIKLDSGGVA